MVFNKLVYVHMQNNAQASDYNSWNTTECGEGLWNYIKMRD